MNVSVLKAPVLFAGACLIAGVAFAQTVRVDYDRDVDFSKFRSYAWRTGQPAANPLMDKRILNAIDGQLASRGWTKTDSSPSAIVTYQAAIDKKRQLNAWGGGPRWTGFGTVTAETILTGELVVDVYDASGNRLVWRGVAADTVSDKPEKNEKRLNDAIAKLFRQFPPGATSRTTGD